MYSINMRTSDADYSNTIIYKISCKDASVTDLYVGHTTDFTKRRKSHRHACEDPKVNAKLYTFIREHGGWQNWKIEIVNFFNCSDLTEARQKEQEYFTSLGATLNSIEPFPSAKAIVENKPKIIVVNPPTTVENNRDTFVCESCDYSCVAKQHYKQHCNTAKHKKCIDNKQTTNDVKFSCNICMKTYMDRSGLWRHKKTCLAPENKIDILLSESQELRNFITEQTKLFTESINTIMENNTELIIKLTELQFPRT
jgi:predicted GIY-YIG superfamily endonuclease